MTVFVRTLIRRSSDAGSFGIRIPARWSPTAVSNYSAPVFSHSPMVHVSNTGEAFRRRFADPDCVMDYPVLHDLRNEGVTDYVVAPLHFSGGEVHFSSWATRQPGGFTDAEIEAIQSLIAPLARVPKSAPGIASPAISYHLCRQECRRARARGTHSPRRYRGDPRRDLAVRHARLHHAGRHAAAAGSGRSAQSLFRLPGAGDHRAWRRSAQIYGRRTVGDFSDRRRARFSTICAAALEAGRAARDQIAALGASDGNGSGLRFGLALHVGDVLFGNIGSGNRLDFTCIGPAVNLAARLEKLAGRLGRTMLASEDFVDQCGAGGLQPIGRFAVAGFAAEQMVYGLVDEGKDAP